MWYDFTYKLTVLGSAALSGFWMPVLTWTLVAAVLLLVLHRWRHAHPLLHTNVRTGLLLMLPFGLLLASYAVIPVDIQFDISAKYVEENAVDGANLSFYKAERYKDVKPIIFDILISSTSL